MYRVASFSNLNLFQSQKQIHFLLLKLVVLVQLNFLNVFYKYINVVFTLSHFNQEFSLISMNNCYFIILICFIHQLQSFILLQPIRIVVLSRSCFNSNSPVSKETRPEKKYHNPKKILNIFLQKTLKSYYISSTLLKCILFT